MSEIKGKTENSLELIEKPKPPKITLKLKLVFLFFGAASLLTWNAILSDIGFFNHFQEKYDPSVSYTFLNFTSNIIFQFILYWKKDIISYKMQLIIGLISSFIALIILPFLVLLFEKNSLTGFILTGAGMFLQGLVNSLCCNGFYALTSFFPPEMIIMLSTGQGVSGILMNFIEYLVIFFVYRGNDEDYSFKLGAIIYFSISGLILLLCLVILLIMYNSEYFKFYLNKHSISEIHECEIEAKSQSDTETEKEDENHAEEGEINIPVQENEKEIPFMELFKKLIDVDLLSCYIFIVTFALFPYVSIVQRLFNTGNYKENTIITIYNIFDTVGRGIVNKMKTTKIITYITVLGRSILLFTLIFNYYCDIHLGMNPNINSILLIINICLLGATNGMGCSFTMELAPTLVPNELKGQAGSSISFFMIFGIFLGSIVSFGTSKIMKQINPDLRNL